MRELLSVLFLCFSFIAMADQTQPLSFKEMSTLSDYIEDRLTAEDVDCSNIEAFVQSYLDLSSANQLYLSMFANQFLDLAYPVLEEGKVEKRMTQTPPEETCMGDTADLKDEIACAVEFISENELTLATQADVIKEVLPQCLSPSN